MEPRATIIVPTRDRAGYLDVALASIVPQAAAAGAEIVVVDDGPSDATRAATVRHGARYVAHDAPRGLNAARNTGIAQARSDLFVFVDDDVAVRPGWLDALLAADAALPPEYGVLTGPIHARFEGHALRACGREGPPITFLDFGPADVDADYAWGANLTVRRSAIERAGLFDEAHEIPAGDEQEWQDRFKATGGRMRYVAGAALDHRRAGDDARLRALCRAAYHRGGAVRRYDVLNARQPSLLGELRVLAGCVVHTVRYRCANGVVLAAHSLGRTRAALRNEGPPPREDFLSGQSGTVGGKRGALRGLVDHVLDVRAARARRAAVRRAAGLPRQRVLALAIDRPEVPGLLPAALTELRASHHEVTVATRAAGADGKFENLNRLLAEHDLDAYDWVLVLDDDVTLPRGFLDAFLALCDEHGFKLAQPAHRRRSHAAWPHTRRRSRTTARRTTFVEIGPVTAFHRDTFSTLLPFPHLRMGWGLDSHWSAVAAQHGWPLGIVDATPVGHLLRPAGDAYPREAAIAEARAFLADRPYVPRSEVR